jgi:predicted PurR-regulated permease PerM
MPGLRPGEWKRIASTTAVVIIVAGLFFVGYHVLVALGRVLALLAVALFFTVVLSPAVDLLHHRTPMKRAAATGVVFVIGFSVLAALGFVLVRPVIDQGQKLADDLPHIVDDAQHGRGTVGRLVKRYHVDKYVREHKSELQDNAKNLGTPAFDVVKKIFTGVFAAVTVMVLTFLMLLEAPELSRGSLRLLPSSSRERVRRVAIESGRAVSGYMAGNLLISLLAGLAAYVYLRIAGVPYAEVWALWVAFADLIPLVGATLGAVPTIAFAFLHSTAAGVAGIIFFILYQQFENHVLQVTIMARTVKINPLAVLVSVLIGVELFGLLGALLAIPVAGVIQVIIRDVWDHRTQPELVEPEPAEPSVM